MGLTWGGCGSQPGLTGCKAGLTWGTAALLLGMACAPEPDAGGGRAAAGPEIVPVDSVLLVETGGFYIGNPFSLVPDTADGSLLISDFFENRILRFDRDGRLLMTYGRPGEGPGEFVDIGPAFILNDSIVVGADDQRKLLQLFSAADGAYLRAFGYRGRLGMETWSVLDGGVVFPSRELAQGTSVAIWRYPRDEIDYVVPLPDEYLRSANHPSGYVGRFAAFFSMGTAVAWRDTIMSGMSGLNEIFLSTWSGQAVDTLALPSARRRGVPPDAQERLDDLGFRGSPHEVLSDLHGTSPALRRGDRRLPPRRHARRTATPRNDHGGHPPVRDRPRPQDGLRRRPGSALREDAPDPHGDARHHLPPGPPQ